LGVFRDDFDFTFTICIRIYLAFCVGTISISIGDI
jgi:hypothetical protein